MIFNRKGICFWFYYILRAFIRISCILSLLLVLEMNFHLKIDIWVVGLVVKGVQPNTVRTVTTEIICFPPTWNGITFRENQLRLACKKWVFTFNDTVFCLLNAGVVLINSNPGQISHYLQWFIISCAIRYWSKRGFSLYCILRRIHKHFNYITAFPVFKLWVIPAVCVITPHDSSRTAIPANMSAKEANDYCYFKSHWNS